MYVLSFFKKGDTIQGRHFLRKYGTYVRSISYHFLGQILETTAKVLLPLFVFRYGRMIKSLCVVM